MFNRILYGGDYNPNQWEKEVWSEDLRIFKKAKINSATINVFSWAKIQPSENVYYFDELDEVIAMLSKDNYDIVLATSTAAMPGWMYKKYPEVAHVDYDGRTHRFSKIFSNTRFCLLVIFWNVSSSCLLCSLFSPSIFFTWALSSLFVM